MLGQLRDEEARRRSSKPGAHIIRQVESEACFLGEQRCSSHPPPFPTEHPIHLPSLLSGEAGS